LEPEADVDSETPPEEDQDAKVQARGKLPLTENRARARAEAASSPPQRDDEDDNLPEDDKDKVSPAKTPLAKGQAATGADQELPKVAVAIAKAALVDTILVSHRASFFMSQ
jgi:hypothetical protein